MKRHAEWVVQHKTRLRAMAAHRHSVSRRPELVKYTFNIKELVSGRLQEILLAEDRPETERFTHD